MIEVYSWATPNGHKVHIMLEECGLPYCAHAVDIGTGDQFKPEFLKISPNNKIPAIVDPDGPDGRPISLFESGAILMYLAGKTGRLLPRSVRGRYEMLQWLMFQAARLGPTMAQARHLRQSTADPTPDVIDRRIRELRQLYAAIDRELARTGAFIAGRQYTIADIAIFPWLGSRANAELDLDDFEHLRRWRDMLERRPAIRRALGVLAEHRPR